MFINENTSRQDLQCAILAEDSLYRSVDEQKFLADGYSDAELFGIIHAWIVAGDEAAL